MTDSNHSSILKSIKNATILGSLGIGFLGFALPVYGKKLGLSAVEIGGLVSLYSIGTLLIRPGIGWAMDRYGRKVFLLISLLLFSMSMLVFALSTGITGLYSARILQAIGGAIFWISAYTIAIDLSDGTDKAKKIGIIDESFGRGGLIGGTIGFSLLGFFHGDNAWSILFLIYTALSFIGCSIVWRKVPETNPKAEVKTTGSSRFIMRRQLVKPVLIILMNTIAISTTSMMSSPIPMLLLQDQYTNNILLLGAASAPITILFSILPSRVGKLSDRIGRTIPICGGLIIVGVSTILISAIHNFYLLVFIWALETAGISLMSPAQAVLLTDKAGKFTSTGSTYGLFTFTTSLSRIIGPIWGGWLYGQYGLHAFQYSGWIILGVALLAFWGLGRGKPQTQVA